MVPDEVQDLDSDLLRHGLDAIIKLGLANGHSSEMELRLSMNKPCLNILNVLKGLRWKERQELP